MHGYVGSEEHFSTTLKVTRLLSQVGLANTVYTHCICIPYVHTIYARIYTPYMLVYTHRLCIPYVHTVYACICPYVHTVYARTYKPYLLVCTAISLLKRLYVHCTCI